MDSMNGKVIEKINSPRITRRDEEPYAYAGLWESWENNGEKIHSTTIITTEANDLIEEIHDRMPVILEPENENKWLEGGDPKLLKDLLDPIDSSKLKMFPVSKKVNNPENDSPGLDEPIDIGGQSDLEDFT